MRMSGLSNFWLKYQPFSKSSQLFLTSLVAEFLGNSGHFLILKSLSDLTIAGWKNYFTDPTEYLLIGAMLTQAIYLSREQASRLFGNLIGVSIYTLIDLPIDKSEFFEDPSHIVFWIFSIIIGLLEGLHSRYKLKVEKWVIPLISIVRMLMLLAFYLVVSVGENITHLNGFVLIQKFLEKNTHLFLIGSFILVGLLLGVRQLQVIVQQRTIKQTNILLNQLARWGMGSHAVNTFIMDQHGLNFQECDRAVLFMDIRGFTTWCEHNQPEVIANLLNQYYQQVEPIAVSFKPLRISFTADEIMVIYTTPEQAVNAARAMQTVAKLALSPYELGAGCAVHFGTVIAGLFGGDDVRTYTVIGDVVNTAKRLESATAAGEITISDTVYQQLGSQVKIKSQINFELKGKTRHVKAWVLADL